MRISTDNVEDRGGGRGGAWPERPGNRSRLRSKQGRRAVAALVRPGISSRFRPATVARHGQRSVPCAPP
ncbi:hypothetical protein JL100_034720 (plasmid) [Skermanella mucosa]|uniref:hypothetical protein n=1 Tax=Skermanella mucosa TaxID=1789672 RepID=UPI00192B9B10|nr:hypothetical protein [Skermanella mucosa]UEM24893.1 hypothetical protein JL100_034720 [Skermanella mucosa]